MNKKKKKKITFWKRFRTGVLAGRVISKVKIGEFKNWLGEKGRGLIGVTDGDNGFTPSSELLYPNVSFIEEFMLLFKFWNKQQFINISFFVRNFFLIHFLLQAKVSSPFFLFLNIHIWNY